MLPQELSQFSDQELLIEYFNLRQADHAPSGLYVSIANSPQSKRWDGLLFLHTGPYSGAIFKFEIKFNDYPTLCPEVFFLSDVWHPLVSCNGAFSTSWRFPSWNSNTDNVSQLLFHIKAAFKESTLSQLKRADCVNQDCFETYYKRKDLFDSIARQCANVSSTRAILFHADKTADRAIRCVENEQMPYEDMLRGITRYLNAQGLS